jgi:NADH:ubiquinone oxidoreductase subunit K
MTDIPLYAVIMVSSTLFALGLLGIMLHASGIRLLMSVEMMLNSANINFVAFAGYWADPSGLVYVLFIIAIAAAEAAVGVAILMNLFRHKGTVNVQSVRAMRW